MWKTMRVTLMLLMATAASGAAGRDATWNFDRDKPGTIGQGWYSAAGAWKVRPDATAPSPPHVLAQLAKNSRDTCNLALVAAANYRNLDIRVKMRAIAGTIAQGGGIAWRAKSARDYYAASYDPLDGNFRLYRVVNNGLVELASVAVMNVAGWHTLRAVMDGDHIECYLDGTKYLDVRDTFYREGGRIGLWTRGDAQTYFDDLTVTAK